MIKHEFISKLLSLYSFVQSKDEFGSYYDSYSRILTNKIDYDKLWDLFSQNFGKYPPTASELKEFAKQCYIENMALGKADIKTSIFAVKNGCRYEFGTSGNISKDVNCLKQAGFCDISVRS